MFNPAFAQTAQPGNALEEIVVTAERREESAQKTPISMSIYTGDALAQAGVHDISTLTAVDPSVNLTTSNGSGYVAIRGITSTDITEIGDPAVSIARDGFFTNRSYGLYSSFYDVDRIEVLKGPQGTLYGRNSTGGVINIISVRPSNEFGGYASLDVGSYKTMNIEGALNLPFSDVIQMRVSGISLYHEGYRDNTPTTQRGDDEDSRSARAQLAIKPFAGLDVLLIAQRDVIDDVGDVGVAGPLAQVYQVPDPHRFPTYSRTSTKLYDTRYRAELTAALPNDLTLKYLGGVDKESYNHALDGTAPPPNTTITQFLVSERPTTQNHELRLASATNQRLFWQAGLFYFSEHNGPLDSQFVDLTGTFANQPLVHFLYDVHTTSKAVFGQTSFAINEDLKISAGARYTRDEKTRTGDAFLDLNVATGGHPPPFLPPPYIITTPGNGAVVTSKPTYHVGLDWTPTAFSLLYAKYDTGYKSGGFNSNGSAPSVNYGPETVSAIELGSKNRFLNDTLQANVALFSQLYKGYQASQATPALGGAPGTQNVGSARIYGTEAEFIGIVPNIVRANLNLAYLHTQFGDVHVLDESGNPVSLLGHNLPNAPAFTAVAGLEHVLDTPYGSLTGRVDGKYETHFNYSFLNYADTEQKGYTTGNASLTYAPKAGKWWLEAYMRNFTDTAYFVTAARQPIGGNNGYQFAPPRTYGLKVTARW